MANRAVLERVRVADAAAAAQLCVAARESRRSLDAAADEALRMVRFAPSAALRLVSHHPLASVPGGRGSAALVWRATFDGAPAVAVAFRSEARYAESLLASRRETVGGVGARCDEVKAGCGVGVALHVLAEYDPIRNELERCLLSEFAERPFETVFATGRGRAGAMATLFGYNWRTLRREDRNGVPASHLGALGPARDVSCVVLSFSAPRLGNQSVANAVTALSEVDELAMIRFVDAHGEAFSEAPMRAMGFVHAGAELSVSHKRQQITHFCSPGSSRTGSGVGQLVRWMFAIVLGIGFALVSAVQAVMVWRRRRRLPPATSRQAAEEAARVGGWH